MITNRKFEEYRQFTSKSKNLHWWLPGEYIWAQMNNRYWPGIIIDHQDAGVPPSTRDKVWIFWFGDHRVSEMLIRDIDLFEASFGSNFEKYRRITGRSWMVGILELLREYGSPFTINLEESDLLQWALDGFVRKHKYTRIVPDFVQDKLLVLKLKYKATLESEKIKIAATPQQKTILEEMANHKKDINAICLGCYSTDIYSDHPLFEGSLCRTCLDQVKNTFHVMGDDAACYYCAICGCMGDMVVCENNRCGKVFCSVCLADLAAKEALQTILSHEIWYCFLCSEGNKLISGLIEIRYDWQKRISELFVVVDSSFASIPSVLPIKKKMTVLSLFDGIGTGLYALEKLNIDVERYYACEIDEMAIDVSSKNFGNKIVHLGNVYKLSNDILARIGPVDLLIGGSPCNDVSLANPCRRGLFDPLGTGTLFFVFYRVLVRLQCTNKKPFFWMYENVASMPVKYKVAITRFLQCEAAMVDAAWFSPQSRPRFFWGNFPTLNGQSFVDDGPMLQDFLDSGRIACVNKLCTITTRQNSLRQGPEMEYSVSEGGEKYDLSVNEMERIFGFPDDYTKVTNVFYTDRHRLLGKCWSVQVICKLFLNLHDYFKTR